MQCFANNVKGVGCILWLIFLPSFIQKPTHRQNGDGTLATKIRFAMTTNNALYTIHISSTFHHFVGVLLLFTNSVYWAFPFHPLATILWSFTNNVFTYQRVHFLLWVLKAVWKSDGVSYHTLMKWKSRFTLGLNTAKKHWLYRKMLQIKVVRIKFLLKKNSGDAYFYLS